jgi:uncharacterized protein
MKIVRIFFRWGLVALGVWLFACAVIGVAAMEAALHPGHNPAALEPSVLAQISVARHHATLADAQVTARDGVLLRAWFIRPIAGNGDAAILLHGLSDNRAGMLGNAELLLDHGYTVLLPDARDHGTSGGEMATYGVIEAADVRRWFDWIQQTASPHCIYGLGESMGAAQLLRSLDEAPDFCAVVAESSFASFREAAYDRLGQRFNAGPWLGRTLLRPAAETGLLYARWKYGLDFDRYSPENAVASSRVPVLLIHGLKDTNLPPRHSEAIRTRLIPARLIPAHSSQRNPPVALWEPAEAGHCGAAGAEPAEFERRVVGWFESHTRQP